MLSDGCNDTDQCVSAYYISRLRIWWENILVCYLVDLVDRHRNIMSLCLGNGTNHARTLLRWSISKCANSFLRITRQHHSLEMMLPVWLLPVVTFVVASSSGGVLAAPLQEFSPSHALITVVFSVFMVTIGLGLSFTILTIYFLRLMVYGLPEGATILSSFLPLGPTGQAGFSVLLIGKNVRSLFPLTYGDSEILRASVTGDTINVICLCVSIMLWSFATMWVIFALLGIHEVARESRIPFKLPFWGLIFPNGLYFLTRLRRLEPHGCVYFPGVYANLTVELYTTLDSPFFRVYGAIYSVVTLLLWIAVATRTVMLVRNQRIFEAPCLEDMDSLMYEYKRKRSKAENLESEGSRSRSRGPEMGV